MVTEPFEFPDETLPKEIFASVLYDAAAEPGSANPKSQLAGTVVVNVCVVP
jgi:hypothetical protein